MILGIPTLCRYDLLAELIASVERGTVRPDEYFVIDNGGGFDVHTAPVRGQIVVLRPGRNLGVATSWNAILRRAHARDEPAIISNDDVLFSETTFEEMIRALRMPEAGVVNGLGWALFGQTPFCTERVGFYDENFYPAYHEDCDYDWRVRVSGISRSALRLPVKHVGSATLSGMPNMMSESDWFRRGELYYVQKWGGPPGSEKFLTAFNGTPPRGWKNEKDP